MDSVTKGLTLCAKILPHEAARVLHGCLFLEHSSVGSGPEHCHWLPFQATSPEP